MSADLGALIPELQPFARELVDLAGRAGVQPRVTSTVRTHSQQQRLYNQYLRGETKYPVAPPGHSAHEFGFAFDMIAASTEDLHDLGAVWKQWGGIWSANDEVHFEFPGFRAPAADEGTEGWFEKGVELVSDAVVPWQIDVPAVLAGVDLGKLSIPSLVARSECESIHQVLRWWNLDQKIPGCDG